MEAVNVSNETCMKLYKKLIEDNDQNTAFSPMSITSILCMVYVGSRGNTEVQMAKVLNLKKAPEKKTCSLSQTKLQSPGAAHIQNISKAFEELFSNINKPSNKYILKSASRLLCEKTFNIDKQYSQLIKDNFQAEIQAEDFTHNAEDVRKKVNTWVEEQTERKIKDLLPQGSVDSLTKLVLVNALYYKGNWNTKFPEENTEQKPFRMSKTQTKMVPMMFQKTKCNMYHNEQFQIKVLELPYEKKETSMIIILPDDINDSTTGLEQLQRELNYVKLKEWTSAEVMKETEVEIKFPRIRLEESCNLKTYLRKMGMSDLFDPEKADLRGISEKAKLCVSDIYHKSFIDINEAGTEAAAATGAVITVRSRPIPVIFHADHPFLFFIRHNVTQVILFFGAFCCP